ncbi:hypothetical protein DFQ28_003148 [Apophysomyces sp. BC1034]|nr:hypothetical protein DFQ30_000271 [Apophysomyces sp. BC1015]KAG0179223.1 hypothetical protein DFQ29_002347 [Apophysomyces sp. BC1021]KAG0189639.1 hypothetical protein DFQ28_003148 [Apophysomyces sp. BC1034]
MSSSLDVCCTLKPVESDYAPVGVMEHLGDLPLYVVGPKDAKKAILVIYDIMGLHKNTQQFCDILANHGYKVVMPDFFRGRPWNIKNIGNRKAVMTWLSKVGTFDLVAPQISQVKTWLQGQGVSSAGIVGFCWGGKIGVQIAGVDRFYGAFTVIHPINVDTADAEKAQAPILALPSKDEPDMTEYMAILKKKPFGAKCKHHRFDDMHHGFAAARGNWSDELNRKRATEAIQLTIDFFNQVLNKSNL